MAVSILHFGQELCDRLALLRNAGYSVHRFEEIFDFRRALESGIEHDAVSISELEPKLSRLVVMAVRSHSSAPLILFRSGTVISFRTGERVRDGTRANPGTDFDLVVPAAPPLTWIADINQLIARSRQLQNQAVRIHEQSSLLHLQAAETTEKTRFEVERGALECARNAGAVSKSLVDRMLRCTDCGADFVFTAGEQYYFRMRNFINDPKHCKACRSIRRSEAPRARPETTVTCADCGVSTTVPFKPTNGRPVLCRACFERHRLTTESNRREQNQHAIRR